MIVLQELLALEAKEMPQLTFEIYGVVRIQVGPDTLKVKADVQHPHFKTFNLFPAEKVKSLGNAEASKLVKEIVRKAYDDSNGNAKKMLAVFNKEFPPQSKGDKWDLVPASKKP